MLFLKMAFFFSAETHGMLSIRSCSLKKPHQHKSGLMTAEKSQGRCNIGRQVKSIVKMNQDSFLLKLHTLIPSCTIPATRLKELNERALTLLVVFFVINTFPVRKNHVISQRLLWNIGP